MPVNQCRRTIAAIALAGLVSGCGGLTALPPEEPSRAGPGLRDVPEAEPMLPPPDLALQQDPQPEFDIVRGDLPAPYSRDRVGRYYDSGRALTDARSDLRRIDRDLAANRFDRDPDAFSRDETRQLRRQRLATESRIRGLERRRSRLAPYSGARSGFDRPVR